MKVNVMEHRPRTEITIADDTIGIMINITDKGVFISIDDNEVSVDFIIDHTTAADISHKIETIIDNWRW